MVLSGAFYPLPLKSEFPLWRTAKQSVEKQKSRSFKVCEGFWDVYENMESLGLSWKCEPMWILIRRTLQMLQAKWNYSHERRICTLHWAHPWIISNMIKQYLPFQHICIVLMLQNLSQKIKSMVYKTVQMSTWMGRLDKTLFFNPDVTWTLGPR